MYYLLYDKSSIMLDKAILFTVILIKDYIKVWTC